MYSQLSYCLEHLGDDRQKREFYRKMMEAFAEETNEHQFAKEKYLGLWLQGRGCSDQKRNSKPTQRWGSSGGSVMIS